MGCINTDIKTKNKEDQESPLEVIDIENLGKNSGIFTNEDITTLNKEDKTETLKNNQIVFTSQTIDYLIFNQEELARHNSYRKKHHTNPLKLNKELIDMAQNYAQNFAQANEENNKKRHLTLHPNDWVGESLYFSYNNDIYVCGSMTDAWYRQVENYDFFKGKSKNGKEINNFAQLVWGSTLEVGFGIAFNEEGIICVANYYPGSNFSVGRFNNVFPIKKNGVNNLKEYKRKLRYDIKNWNLVDLWT